MLKDGFQLVQPDMLHTMDLGVAAIRASMASSGSDDPDRLWVWWNNDHQGLAPELAQELAPSPDVGLQEPAQELEVVVPMCEDWDAPPPLVDLGSMDVIPEHPSNSSNEWICEDGVSKVGDEHSESSANIIGTYQDPELMGSDSEWCVIARGIGDSAPVPKCNVD